MATTTAEPKETKRKAKRRGNGEGSIFQRSDGRWTATITVGRDATGKRIRKTVYGWTKKEAQDKLVPLMGQKLDGTLSTAKSIKVAAFLDRWMADSVKPSTKPATHHRYTQLIDLYIKPRIGGLSLPKLTPSNVQGVYSAMERAGQSSGTQRMVHAVLHRAFRKAIKWGYVPRNVCDAVDPPRAEKHEFVPLTAEQTVKFLEAAKGNRLEALYTLAVTTGMRQGELFGLQWPDVDLKAGTISVQRTAVEIGGVTHVGEPKSKKGKRLIELPAMAVQALWAHKARMLAEGHASSPWVFCNLHGNMLSKTPVRRRSFRPLLVKAGLPTIRFHDLRHGHATLLLAGGIHPRIVQERMGHSQISVTLDTYSHVMKGMGRDTANFVDSALSQTGT